MLLLVGGCGSCGGTSKHIGSRNHRGKAIYTHSFYEYIEILVRIYCKPKDNDANGEHNYYPYRINKISRFII